MLVFMMRLQEVQTSGKSLVLKMVPDQQQLTKRMRNTELLYYIWSVVPVHQTVRWNSHCQMQDFLMLKNTPIAQMSFVKVNTKKEALKDYIRIKE